MKTLWRQSHGEQSRAAPNGQAGATNGRGFGR